MDSGNNQLNNQPTTSVEQNNTNVSMPNSVPTQVISPVVPQVEQTQNVEPTPVVQETVKPEPKVEEKPIEVKSEPAKQVPQENQKQQDKKEEIKIGKFKVNKNTFIRIVAGVVILLMVAVYFLFFFKDNRPVDMTDPKSVTKFYVQSAIDMKYTDTFNYVYLPENSLVTYDDFNKYLDKNKFYSEVVTNTINTIKKVDGDDTTATYNVLLNNGRSYDVNLTLEPTGNWKVVVNDFYIKGWQIQVPHGSKLYINGSLVNSSFATKGTDNFDAYTLTAITPGDKDVKVETVFETKETKVDVASSNSGEKVLLELSNEKEIQKALDYIKETWNAMYQAYLNGTDKEVVLKKYFDSKYTTVDMDKYYIGSFDTLTRKGNKNSVYKNIELESIIAHPDKKSAIEENDIIKVEFGYKVNFLVDFVYAKSKDWNENMTRYSTIKLRKTNDGYVIYQITDEKLLNYLNYTIHEYK